tara:strand:+ start:912 stop:1214 length:303 start_codon:yes stop_codon:yes gene_type:complete
MIRKILLLSVLLLLNNCVTSGTALLGPIFTGAKTGSVYQASLSYGSGKLIKQLSDNEIFSEKNIQENNIFLDTKTEPKILLSYKVDKIIFSEVLEIEHLP